jgi:hypothetical protein
VASNVQLVHFVCNNRKGSSEATRVAPPDAPKRRHR